MFLSQFMKSAMRAAGHESKDSAHLVGSLAPECKTYLKNDQEKLCTATGYIVPIQFREDIFQNFEFNSCTPPELHL